MAKFKVEVDNHGTYEVNEGVKLVNALEGNGVDVSHRCGGQAKCTTCRVKFHSEEPPMGDDEKQVLEEDGILGEARLSCQIRVDRDMRVQVLMPVSQADWDTPGPDVDA
jgi:ferredoxin